MNMGDAASWLQHSAVSRQAARALAWEMAPLDARDEIRRHVAQGATYLGLTPEMGLRFRSAPRHFGLHMALTLVTLGLWTPALVTRAWPKNYVVPHNSPTPSGPGPRPPSAATELT